MLNTPVATRDEWLAARKTLLQKEKELTRLRDEISNQRRQMPRVRIDKEYSFDGPAGPETLAELFEGRQQLITYHFMFDPEWKDGCKICSMFADSYDRVVPHLTGRDVTMVTVSSAPRSTLEAFKKRMGWSFKWVSCGENDFNCDYGVTFGPEDKEKGEVVYNYRTGPYGAPEMPGISVFCKDDYGAVYHTYSAYSRGLDTLMGMYQLLDITPRGRDEAALPFSMAWVKLRDQY